MKALVLNCTLKRSPEPSSTEALARVLMRQWETDGIDSEMVRLADHDILPGVESDMGPGDAWPPIREKIRACDILVIATPIWLGQMSSIAKRALERMDAILSETDDQGRPWAMGKVAGVVITGNEDGAHHVVATVLQPLVDVGFTAPGQAWTYWHLGPGPGPDYTETDQGHDYSDRVGRNAARNLTWVARALAGATAPAQETGE